MVGLYGSIHGPKIAHKTMRANSTNANPVTGFSPITWRAWLKIEGCFRGRNSQGGRRTSIADGVAHASILTRGSIRP